MANSPDTGARRILITRMKFIGDVVLTTPVIRSVRAAYPHGYIAYMGEKSAVSLLEQNPFLDEIIPYDYSRPSVIEQARMAYVLRKRRFDLVVDLFGNPRSALLSRLSGAPVRVGPERKGRGKLYTVQVADDGLPKTAVEFHNRSLAAAGITPGGAAPEIFLSDDERRDARAYLRWSLGDGAEEGNMIGIHPGATWPAKKWLPERFAALADLIRAKLSATVVLVGGPGDRDAVEAVRALAVTAPHRLNVLPLRQLAAVISCFSAFVANDAGPMHIAAALGIPTIGIFGPGEENIWFPYDASRGHTPLRHDVPCHPCHLDFCNRTGDGYMECMKLLTVEDVFAALRKSLSR